MSTHYVVSSLGRLALLVSDLGASWRGGLGYYAPRLVVDSALLLLLKNSADDFKEGTLLFRLLQHSSASHIFSRFFLGLALQTTSEMVRIAVFSRVPHLSYALLTEECKSQLCDFQAIQSQLDECFDGISDLSAIVWQFVGDKMDYDEFQQLSALRSRVLAEDKKSATDRLLQVFAFYLQRLKMVFDNESFDLLKRNCWNTVSLRTLLLFEDDFDLQYCARVCLFASMFVAHSTCLFALHLYPHLLVFVLLNPMKTVRYVTRFFRTFIADLLFGANSQRVSVSDSDRLYFNLVFARESFMDLIIIFAVKILRLYLRKLRALVNSYREYMPFAVFA